jgi:hypothetical protein
MIPVPAVLEMNGEFACWVETANGIERRQLLLGMSNDQMVEVVDGVAEGETVVLNPRATIPEARRTSPPPAVAEPNQGGASPAES